HLGHALRELGRVVAHGDDGVRVDLPCMFHHPCVSLGTGAFADFLVGADVTAQDTGERPAKSLRDGLRPDNNPPDDTEILANAVAVKLVSRSDEHVLSHRTLLFSACGSTSPESTSFGPVLPCASVLRRSTRQPWPASPFAP